VKNGTLEKVLDSRVEQAILILQQCEENGLSPDQAREPAYYDLFQPPPSSAESES